jgi:hypothetical protein
MELVALLRVLWRHKLVVAAGGLLAIGLAVMLANKPTTRFGAASSKVLIDTPTSQLVDADPVGAPTLAWRAALLAELMGTDAIRVRIAREMGVAPQSLVITAPSQAVAPIPLPLPVKALDAAAASAARKPLQLSIDELRQLPIVRIDARAPSRRTAARLVTVASTVLADAVRAPAASATVHPVDLQDLVAHELGPVRSRAIVNGPRRVMAAGMAIAVFVLWCSGVMLISGLARARRRARGVPPSEVAWLFGSAGQSPR